MLRRSRKSGPRTISTDQPSTGPETGWLRLPAGSSADVSVKPAAYLPVYEELLAPLRPHTFSMLELGVWKGDSLQMWRDAFPHATIVGVDLGPPALDLGPRVQIVTGDQSDPELLARLREQHAPDGFSLIIDDGSHLGGVTARSLQALYREHLAPGGLYIIEDWGTGYVASWPDGGVLDAVIDVSALDHAVDAGEDGEQSLPSHDLGMVGLVKRLVDHTASGTLSVHQPDQVRDTLPIAWMRVQDGLVILKKST
jgi:hypothetical protein